MQYITKYDGNGKRIVVDRFGEVQPNWAPSLEHHLKVMANAGELIWIHEGEAKFLGGFDRLVSLDPVVTRLIMVRFHGKMKQFPRSFVKFELTEDLTWLKVGETNLPSNAIQFLTGA